MKSVSVTMPITRRTRSITGSFDAVTAQQRPGVFQRRTELDFHDIARHDVSARDLAEATPISVHFSLQKQRFEVIAANVKHLIILLEHCVQVLRPEAQPIGERPVSGAVAVGINML